MEYLLIYSNAQKRRSKFIAKWYRISIRLQHFTLEYNEILYFVNAEDNDNNYSSSSSTGGDIGWRCKRQDSVCLYTINTEQI